MVPEIFAHRVIVECVEEGTAVARLEPSPEIGPDTRGLETEAVVALAQHSSSAALNGAIVSIHPVRTRAVRSEITHFREACGPLSAAALVDRELTSEVADDLRRSGSVRANVSVAVVDDDGETVALGTFEFDINHP
jgi:hypothetical protein